MVYKILQGHILDKINELEDNSINLCITSPPYWGLRDYGEDTNTVIWSGGITLGWGDCQHIWGIPQDKGGRIKRKQDIDPKQTQLEKNEFLQKFENFCTNCNAWKGQLGLEPTFGLFIQHLVQIFEAIKPKLRDDGSLWINLGDTYAGNNSRVSTNGRAGYGNEREGIFKIEGAKTKSLIGIPDRFKIAMIDKGWICRNEIIWYKPSAMPSSAKDRFTVDFEKFFFFTKNKKYYFKQQFEPMNIEENEYRKELRKDKNYNTKKYMQTVYSKKHTRGQYADNHSGYFNEDGSLRGNVEGRNKRTTWFINPKGFKEAHFAVYPEALIEIPIDACCPEKGIVLDPFSGSGTTGVVTQKQNKEYIGIEINPEYIKIAKKRLDRYNYVHLNDDTFNEFTT